MFWARAGRYGNSALLMKSYCLDRTTRRILAGGISYSSLQVLMLSVILGRESLKVQEEKLWWLKIALLL
jgi:hypothetical protein